MRKLRKTCPICGKKYLDIQDRRCPQCDDVDLEAVRAVYLIKSAAAWRRETEEEFDPVMTNFLTELDGWQHYETKTVEYDVENGKYYVFMIKYADDSLVMRIYHSSSQFVETLTDKCNCNCFTYMGEILGLVNALYEDIELEVCENDYETAVRSFQRMKSFYGLDSSSSANDLQSAAIIQLTSFAVAACDEYCRAIYELMLFLMSTKGDGDIFEKTDVNGLSFIQNSEKGKDAFAVLPKGTDVTDRLVKKYERIREKSGYRKMVLLTNGTKKTEIEYPNTVIYDRSYLLFCYVNAFKNVVQG